MSPNQPNARAGGSEMQTRSIGARMVAVRLIGDSPIHHSPGGPASLAHPLQRLGLYWHGAMRVFLERAHPHLDPALAFPFICLADTRAARALRRLASEPLTRGYGASLRTCTFSCSPCTPIASPSIFRYAMRALRKIPDSSRHMVTSTS